MKKRVLWGLAGTALVLSLAGNVVAMTQLRDHDRRLWIVYSMATDAESEVSEVRQTAETHSRILGSLPEAFDPSGLVRRIKDLERAERMADESIDDLWDGLQKVLDVASSDSGSSGSSPASAASIGIPSGCLPGENAVWGWQGGLNCPFNQ